ncbi:hypothetical protein ACF0H5_019262 [Mactra antiquata]
MMIRLVINRVISAMMNVSFCFAVIVTVSVLVCTTNGAPGPNIPDIEKDPQYWNDLAKRSIMKRFGVLQNNNKAKNVILFVGDGMGPTTVTAARILRGQSMGMPGEETELEFEKFPNVALSKTYNIDRQTADSAGTATAFLSGVKTNYFVIGLDSRSIALDCESQHGTEVETIADWAAAAGKKTGIVTTSRITHATPASAYAHAADRYWEGDVDTQSITGGCRDIAQQLVDDNKHFNVLLGGGRRTFLPNTTRDPEYNTIHSKHRLDGRNLIKEWQDDKQNRSYSSAFVWNKKQFDEVDPYNTQYLMGLFEPNHMQYELDRDTTDNGEPSLAEMTKKAIQILQQGDEGFFLLVEGARIDHAHHDGLAQKALVETLMLEDAVKEALKLTNTEDTLIIVTADHSHVFDIAGYAYRGTDIFGLVEPVDPTEDTTDKKPYSVLYYGNGPNYQEPRQNLSEVDMHDKDFAFPAGVPMPWETHGGEDVAIYADGPMSHLFNGVQEQNYIAHVMAYAMCVGPYSYDCRRPSDKVCVGSAGSLAFLPVMYLLVIALIVKTISC